MLAKAKMETICSVVTDGTHDSPKLQSSGVPFIKGKHISKGFVDFDSCDFITEADHAEACRRVRPQSGDVLFSNIGSVGDTARVPPGREFSIKNVALFRPDPGKIDPRYFYYLVVNPTFKESILSLKSGSAQPFLTLGSLRGFEATYHTDRPQQRRIASILSAYDDLIENNYRRIAILEEMARRIYEEWFVRFRFPGHETERMVESELGPVPNGWKVQRLDELAEIRGGKQLEKESISLDGTYPVYGGNGIQGFSEISTHRGFVIAFGRVGAYCGSIHWSLCGAWLNNNSSSVVPHDYPELILQHLLNFDFGPLRGGAAQPFISNGALAGAKFAMPSDEIARRFVQILNPMRCSQHRLIRSISNLRITRDLLLPKLISGELDLSALTKSEAIAS